MRQDKAHRSPVEDLQRQLGAVADFAQVALRTEQSLEDLLQAACKAACAGSGLSRAKAMLRTEHEQEVEIVAGIGWRPGVIGMRLVAHPRSTLHPALRADRTLVVNDLPHDPAYDYEEPMASHGIVSLVNVPIRTDAAVLGVLEIDSDEPIELDSNDVRFLTSLAALAGAATVRHHVELAASQAAAVATRLAAERETQAAELEHRVANHLHQIRLALEVEARRSPTDDARHAYGVAIHHLQGMIDALQRLGHRPSGGAEAIEMEPFLRALAEDFSVAAGIRIEVRCDPAIALPAPKAVGLGRLAAELVMNATKHAFIGRSRGSVRIELTAASAAGACTLVVTDDGVGMQPPRGGGRGVALIEAMARELGGTASRDETPGTGGTRVRIDLP